MSLAPKSTADVALCSPNREVILASGNYGLDAIDVESPAAQCVVTTKDHGRTSWVPVTRLERITTWPDVGLRVAHFRLDTDMQSAETGAAMSKPMLTDSGLETWLVFHRSTDLPHFAAFPLLDDPRGRELLAEYFSEHLRIAAAAGTGAVLETPTWRANPDWGARLGYDAAALDRVNRDAVAFLRGAAEEHPEVAVVVSGNIGPRGDGYNPSELLTAEVAEAYHRAQIESFAAAGVDRVTMLTATHTGEPIGVIRAAVAAGVPVVIAFTVETDGRLPSGQELHEAIVEVDRATDRGALHFGINCAHPDHFSGALEADPAAIGRIELIRANASRASHAELDEAEQLDDGDPIELGSLYAALLRSHPHLRVLGGCCGTDARHVEAIARACAPAT